MAEITSYPNLETYKPWDPPLPPFQWRKVDMGPEALVEFLFDARGRQVFNGSFAIKRKAGTSGVIWPEEDRP